MPLRPKQIEALDAVKEAFAARLLRVVVVAATGFGKTVVFANIKNWLGIKGQILVLAHREELLDQAKDKILAWNPHLKVGIEQGERYASVDDDIVIVSVATWGREGSKRMSRFDKGRVECIIVDECHHSVADSYLTIFNYFGALDDSSNIFLVGVTATPGRGDGQGLAKVYKKIVFQYTMRQAIEDGYLVDLKPYRIKLDADLDKVKTRSGEFDKGELAEEVNTPANNQIIVKAFKKRAADRRAIGFTVDVQHAKDLAEMFEHYGIKAAAIWGEDPDRAWKLARHRGPEAIKAYCIENGMPVPSKEAMQDLSIQVLFNYGVLTEGYDDWQVSCIIWARPSKSQVAVAQGIGRGTRLPDGVDNLKEALAQGWAVTKSDCIVLDTVGMSKRHSLVTVPSLFGINAMVDLEGQSIVDSVKQIEEAQQKNPDVDFSKLERLDDIRVLIEEADLWNVKVPEDILHCSSMSWHVAWDGAYTLTLPSGDTVTIRQNMLEQWEITATLKGTKYRGVRSTMEDAFTAAEELIIKVDPDATKVLWRESKWHNDKPSEGQLQALKRLYKGKTLPASLTKGQASRLIDKAKAEEVQVPATLEQLGFIRKFTKGKGIVIPDNLTKNQAKKMIAEFIRGKVTGVKP